MDITIDPAQILVATTGLVALLTGLRQKRKSADRQDRIQSARTELERREQQRVESLDAHVAKDHLIESLQAQHDRDQADKERIQQATQHRLDERQAQYDEDIARERAARTAEREMYLRELTTAREEYAAVVAMLRGQADETAAGEGVTTHRAHLTKDSDNPA